MEIRDTDADWHKIGSEEPFYGVLVHDRFLRANIDAEALAAFWASGRADIDHVLHTIERHLGDFAPRTALDFGCGVGRLTRAMAGHCAEVTGVDISAGMLAAAREHALPNMALVDAIPDTPVDWIHSSMVFQHIPPERGYRLFDTLLDRLAPGGVFSIHVTLFKTGAYLAAIARQFEAACWDGASLRYIRQGSAPEGTMFVYDYDLTRLVMSAILHDIHEFDFNHSDHGGCHGVTLYGRRAG